MSLGNEKLLRFKKELTDRRDRVVAGLRQASQELSEHDTLFTDTADQASADFERELTVRFTHRDREILMQIDEALKRIEDGTFGECEQCGESIAEARMSANPATTLCIDCKAEIESEKNRYPGRA